MTDILCIHCGEKIIKDEEYGWIHDRLSNDRFDAWRCDLYAER